MYKTILLHADAARSAPERLRLAALLAARQQAHLVCAAMTGISRHVYRQATGLAQAEARQVLDAHARLAATLGLSSCEHRLVEDDAYGGLVLQSRYADLLVLGQPDRDDPATGALLQDLPEYVILNSCCPVLLAPIAGRFDTIGENVLLAWDGSLQAARAVARALPLLALARRVQVLMVDPVSGPDQHGEEPGADIALFLARHGVRVEVGSLQSAGEVGETLLAAADQAQSDLLVMGAYGQSRVREIMLGGATSAILACAALPVLLAR